MSQQHTPEPWELRGYSVYHKNGWLIADCEQLGIRSIEAANARRIVACVNACEDILDYELSLGCVARLSEQLRTVTKQRDDLLAALDQVSATRNIGSAHIIAREAIASVKEKA